MTLPRVFITWACVQENLLAAARHGLRQKFSAYVSPEITDGLIKAAYEGNNEGVYLSITNKNGAVIYSERTGIQSNFTRRYDLSKLPKGKCTLQVLHGEKNIEQTYEVK